MIKTISKPKPQVQSAPAPVAAPVSRAPLGRKGPAPALRSGKVTVQMDMLADSVMGGNPRMGSAPSAAPAADGKRRMMMVNKKSTTSSQSSARRPTSTLSRPKPADSGMGLAPIIIGVIVVAVLLIVGIVAMNGSRREPVQTWQGEKVPETVQAESRPMKEWMEQHGGGSQALKDRQSRVRGGGGRDKATFVHNTRTGETKDLNSDNSSSGN